MTKADLIAKLRLLAERLDADYNSTRYSANDYDDGHRAGVLSVACELDELLSTETEITVD